MAVTLGNLTVTQYDDGTAVLNAKKNGNTLYYHHLTSAEATALEAELAGAGVPGAPTDDSPVPEFPGDPNIAGPA